MENNTTFQINLDGHACVVRIAPYSLHTDVTDLSILPSATTMARGFSGAESHKVPTTSSNLTIAAATASIKKAKGDTAWLVPCCTSGCAKPAWSRTVFPSQYRDAHCEDCWQTAFAKRLAIQHAKRDAREAIEDAKRKAQGDTHKTIAWVHPNSGDDYSLLIYSKGALTEPEIAALLRKRGSRVCTDFKQVAL